jgi:DNA-binding NarL/FixJ family response regulator
LPKRPESILNRAPPDLDASTFQVGGDQFVIFSFSSPKHRIPEGLSNAEREVVAGVLRGRRNAQIAADRGTSQYTVMNQLASVYRKLGVGSRWELVAGCAQPSSRRAPKKRAPPTG